MKTLQSLLNKEKIAIISCYDASFASMLSRTHVDALLVGDSLGTRIKGEKNILNVTMDEVIYHIRAVKMVQKNYQSLLICQQTPITINQPPWQMLKKLLKLVLI